MAFQASASRVEYCLFPHKPSITTKHSQGSEKRALGAGVVYITYKLEKMGSKRRCCAAIWSGHSRFTASLRADNSQRQKYPKLSSPSASPWDTCRGGKKRTKILQYLCNNTHGVCPGGIYVGRHKVILQKIRCTYCKTVLGRPRLEIHRGTLPLPQRDLPLLTAHIIRIQWNTSKQ